MLKVKGFRAGWTDSDTATAVYIFNYGTLAAPTMTPAAGTYITSVDVTLAAAAGAVHYTTNGTDPSTASPTYTAPLALTQTTTLKAAAFQVDWTPSATTTGTYEIKVATPTLSPGGGTYSSVQSVVVTCTTPSATINYTTNGADPTPTDPEVASGSAVQVDDSLTLKAKASKPGTTSSDVASETYTINLGAAALTFNPPGGSYNVAQTVTISSDP